MFTEIWFVMLFYAILSSFIAPLLGYHFNGPKGLGQGYVAGYVAGSVLSVILWFAIGKKYAKI